MSSISVVVPCYRYGHLLRECVESVLTQAGADVHVLILDDASPDHTPDVGLQLAKEDSRVTFVRHATNKGHIATYNEGIEWASCDYFLLLSADDYLLPGALSRASALMDRHADVGLTFGSVVELYSDGETKAFRCAPTLLKGANHRIVPGLEFIEISSARNLVPTPTAVVRTELQKTVGGYRPELPHAGDMEMWLRLAAHASVAVVGDYQAVYRRHGTNMSLEYTLNRWLPDLQQRAAAVGSFIEHCGDMLPRVRDTHRKMINALGVEAVTWASAAFNDGDMDLSNELSIFAVRLCPDVKRSLAWRKFALKRRLGIKGWRALQPAFRLGKHIVAPRRREAGQLRPR